MKKQKKTQQLKPIDQPLFGYIEALIKSFYSSQLYVDVAKRWKGIGLMYLLLAVIVFSLPVSIKMIFTMNREVNEALFLPIQTMPPLVVQNGEVLFDKPMPYLIRDKKGQVKIIIDTTGSITELTNKLLKKYPELLMLVKKRQVLYMTNLWSFQSDKQPDVESQGFDEKVNEVFDGKSWLKESGVHRMVRITIGLIPLITIGLLYPFVAGLLLALALLGQVFSQVFFSYKLKFNEASRLIMVAATPAMALVLFLVGMNWTFDFSGIAITGLIALYFSYGVIIVKSHSQKLARK